jgi:hypothetical protein
MLRCVIRLQLLEDVAISMDRGEDDDEDEDNQME